VFLPGKDEAAGSLLTPWLLSILAHEALWSLKWKYCWDAQGGGRDTEGHLLLPKAKSHLVPWSG
jgi:hypothetical protein